MHKGDCSNWKYLKKKKAGSRKRAKNFHALCASPTEMRRNPTRPLPPPALALLLLAGVAEGRLRNAKVLSREPAQAAAAEGKPATPKYSRQCALPAHLPCERPVARSPVKWSGYMERSLLGESHPPHMESGYVNVTAEDYLFYLFFGPHEAAPRCGSPSLRADAAP